MHGAQADKPAFTGWGMLPWLMAEPDHGHAGNETASGVVVAGPAQPLLVLAEKMSVVHESCCMYAQQCMGMPSGSNRSCRLWYPCVQRRQQPA